MIQFFYRSANGVHCRTGVQFITKGGWNAYSRAGGIMSLAAIKATTLPHHSQKYRRVLPGGIERKNEKLLFELP